MPPYIPPPARSKSWRRPFSNQSSTPKPLQSASHTTQPTNQTSSSIAVQTNNSSSSRLKSFSRLRPAPIQKDPLQAAGLPSKGDTALLPFAAQESYYSTLNSRYMSWCAATGTQNVKVNTLTPATRKPSAGSAAEIDISQELSMMSLDGSSYLETLPQQTPTADTDASTSIHAQELSILLMSMRKLREALLSTSRTDPFAAEVYMFIIRASILLRHSTSYHPALHHLLSVIYTTTKLSKSALHEFTSYVILDTACRLGEYGEALALRARYHFRDRDVDALLRALMRDDFVAFWRVRRRLDGYAASLAGWADEGVRRHALKCVGKAYLNVDRRFLERVAGGRGWGDLVAMDGVGWELVSDKDCDGEEGQVVVVRRVKGGKR